jgi:glycosyltransferase involved in cell wall biosynthesis
VLCFRAAGAQHLFNNVLMKKFLLITYYWPPAGGGGVQRWLKMTKYFREYGWEPIIYTAEAGEQAAYDPSLVKEVPEGLEVVRTPIWEPYDLYKKFTGKKKEEKVYSGFISEGKKSSFTQDLSVFIRGNFFIPDARRFWIKPSIRFLKKYLEEHPVDAIISTGPPHSMHMIALGVKKHHDIPWIADFRDPWTQQDFYDQLKLTWPADLTHKRMEQKVLKKADRIVTVSWSWVEDFKALSKGREVDLITNGFDPADFQTTVSQRDEAFTICHIGSMNKDRNPQFFWKALSELKKEYPGFGKKLKIKLIGQVDFSIQQAIQQYGLTDQLERLDFMPHADVVEHMKKAQLLLLPINSTPNAMGILPGKLYEYLGARRPVLAVGPLTSDAAKVIQLTQAGTINDYDDLEGLKTNISNYFQQYQEDTLEVESSGIEQFSRKALAGKYAELLKGLK